MTEPKIKYDIEAAVKGEADAQELARALRAVGETLEGGLQQGAQAAAQALENLGAKQRAIDGFAALQRQASALAPELGRISADLAGMGNQLQQAQAQTGKLAAAERSAITALAQARVGLQAKREALKALSTETVGAARNTEQHKAAVAGLRQGIQSAAAQVREHQQAQRSATQATGQAAQAESALRTEYELLKASSIKLGTELGNKNRALADARETMWALGMGTQNLAKEQASLQTGLAQVRQEVAAAAPAYQRAAAASSQATQTQVQNQRTLRQGMTSISTQLQTIQSLAYTATGGSFLGGAAKSAAETADELHNLEARIKLATGEGQQFHSAFSGVGRIALATNSALDETGTLFARLAKAGQEAGQSAKDAQQNALGLTQTINQTIQLSGGSAQSAKAAVTQLIQGLQSGVLRGEEFNAVMEQAPRLAQALANGLNLTTGELRNMAQQGALTADVVMKALQGQADAVAAEFAKLPPTVGRALQNLSTQWTLFAGNVDKGLLASETAANTINALASNLDTVAGMATRAGAVLAAALAVEGVLALRSFATQMAATARRPR